MCVLCTTPSLYSDTKEPFVPADLTKKTAIDKKNFLKMRSIKTRYKTENLLKTRSRFCLFVHVQTLGFKAVQ